jgi:hypothetical protein
MKKIVGTLEIETRPTCVLLRRLSRRGIPDGRAMVIFGEELPELLRHLTPLALDGGDSAVFQALSTPEVLSTLQSESTPAHRK